MGKAAEEHPGGIRTYTSETQDFLESADQDLKLPPDYRWLRRRWFERVYSEGSYALAGLIGFVFSHVYLHAKVVNGNKFRKCPEGFFIYGNHTQPVGDCFVPARFMYPTRLHTVVSAANLGIPVLGKWLPYLGALPLPESMSQMKTFLDALKFYTDRGGGVLVYPEAHVWPYCTFIRPYDASSFKFPVMFGRPAYCMTTTYQKRKHGKKPKVTVYLDGPFYPDKSLKSKAAQRKLHDEIEACMKERSKESTYEYIEYVRQEEP